MTRSLACKKSEAPLVDTSILDTKYHYLSGKDWRPSGKFLPSYEWQDVPRGVEIPSGLEEEVRALIILRRVNCAQCSLSNVICDGARHEDGVHVAQSVGSCT